MADAFGVARHRRSHREPGERRSGRLAMAGASWAGKCTRRRRGHRPPLSAKTGWLRALDKNAHARWRGRGGLLALATKGEKLDWSLGDAVQPLREKTGADYALFTWMRA